ncbi:MAG: DMT family transporter [Bacteroidales bacterium]
MKHSPAFIPYLSVTTAVILWGFSFIWTNSLLQQGLPVFSLIFLRVSFAAIILLIVSLTAKKLEPVAKRDWGWFLLLVLLEPFIYFIGETFGLKIVNSPTLGSIIISTIPIFALFAGKIFYNEKITGFNIFGILITLPGILMIVFEKGGLDFSHSIGVLLLFLAVFAAVGYAVVVKQLTGKYNSYTIVTYQNLLGALYFFPLFLYNDSVTFSFGTFLNIDILKPLLYLAVFCSALAFVLFVNSVKAIGITRSNIFTSMVPVVSALGAFMLGQEGMSSRKIVGIVIVVAGVIIAQRQKSINNVN